MPLSLPSFSPLTIRNALITLAIAAVGGFAFQSLGLPAPWLAGAAILVAGAAVAGVPAIVPRRLRDAIFVVLGVSMGGGVTPETVHRLAEWPVSLAILFVTVVAVTASIYAFLRAVSGWSRDTALLAALPGALSYVVAAAIQRGADVRRVAASQSVRLLFLVAVLPPVIGGHGVAVAALPAVGLGELALLLGVGLAAGLAAERLGVPAGLLFGAFLASAALHATGVVAAALPVWLTIPAFTILGAFIGTRFAGAEPSFLLRMLPASLGALAIGIVVAAAGAYAAAWATGQGLGGALLAFAPGGIEAMTALAFMLHADPAYVAAHQLARFILIALTLPIVLKLLGPPGRR